MKIKKKKVNFHVFFNAVLTLLKYLFAFVLSSLKSKYFKVSKIFFTDPNPQSIQHFLSLTPHF